MNSRPALGNPNPVIENENVSIYHFQEYALLLAERRAFPSVEDALKVEGQIMDLLESQSIQNYILDASSLTALDAAYASYSQQDQLRSFYERGVKSLAMILPRDKKLRGEIEARVGAVHLPKGMNLNFLPSREEALDWLLSLDKED